MAFPGFPGAPQNPGGMSDMQRQNFEMQQAAAQRLAGQMFQQSCLFKTGMSGVGGFAIGGAMGMFLSGMRYDAPGAFALPGSPPGLAGINPDLKWHRQLYIGLKDMGTQGLRSAKSFGKIGAMFAGTECVIESYRAKSDVTNPVLAGCLVGGWLARNQGPMAICGGCAAFAAFSYGIELYMHRETEEED